MPAHYDMRFVKPLDEELLHEVFTKFDKIITVEDGTVVGGFGRAVLEFMACTSISMPNLSYWEYPTKSLEHGYS